MAVKSEEIRTVPVQGETQSTDVVGGQGYTGLKSLELIQTVLHKPSSGPLLAYDSNKMDWHILVRKEVRVIWIFDFNFTFFVTEFDYLFIYFYLFKFISIR